MSVYSISDTLACILDLLCTILIQNLDYYFNLHNCHYFCNTLLLYNYIQTRDICIVIRGCIVLFYFILFLCFGANIPFVMDFYFLCFLFCSWYEKAFMKRLL